MFLAMFVADHRRLPPDKLGDARTISGRKPIRLYVYGSLAIIAIGLGLMAWQEIATKRAEPVKVIVESDRVGYVVVVYNVKDGSPIQYDGKHRVYEVPADGILRTQFTSNFGEFRLEEQEFFVREASGDLRPVQGELRGVGTSDAAKPCQIEFENFHVDAQSTPAVNMLDSRSRWHSGVQCIGGQLFKR
jgi:hypothetical protein